MYLDFNLSNLLWNGAQGLDKVDNKWQTQKQTVFDSELVTGAGQSDDFCCTDNPVSLITYRITCSQIYLGHVNSLWQNDAYMRQ